MVSDKVAVLLGQLRKTVNEIDAVGDLSAGPEALRAILEVSENLVRIAGYWSAQQERTNAVTELMLISARLDRLAQDCAPVI